MQPSNLMVWILSPSLLVLGIGATSGQTASTGSGQAASTRSGQAYPNKPIRMVTSTAGGGGDFVARLVAQGITGGLGQTVVVDNRPSGIILGETVAKAPPDGYTLLLTGASHWLLPLLQDAPYEPGKDFSPITLAVSSSNILAVHPALPVISVKELIAIAKARPGELNYSASPTGSSAHLAAELFKSMAGLNIVRVTYKGGGPALNALIAGEVQLTFGAAASVTPHVKSGKLRALAITSAKPSLLAPGLPTVAASGVSGYESVSPFGIFAPAKTPTAIINRLNQEILRALNRADVMEKLLSVGVETVGSTPQLLAATVKSEMIRWNKIIKEAGIRAD